MPHRNNRSRNLSCPECQSNRIANEEVDHRFPYGQGDSATELSARIPVHKCEECGNEVLDDKAEDLMHNAVCRHLQVMTPSEVRTIRQQSGDLSQADLAITIRVDEATISKWERGELIQSPAHDQLLHLLHIYHQQREQLNHVGLGVSWQSRNLKKTSARY